MKFGINTTVNDDIKWGPINSFATQNTQLPYNRTNGETVLCFFVTVIPNN